MFGTLTERLNIKYFSSSIWYVLLLFKWLLITIILLFVRDYPGLQISVLFVLSLLFQCLIIYIRPYNERIENFVAFSNELLVSMYLYTYIFLTDMIIGQQVKDLAGLFLMAIVFTFVLINFMFLGYQIVCECLSARRKRLARR